MKMNTKKYRVEHDTTMASILVEIDFDYTYNHPNGEVYSMDMMIKEMVDFWSGAEERVAENDGDYTNTYLIQLCELCIDFYDDLGLKKLISEIQDEEGYYKVDGSHGIKLLKFTEPDFSDQKDYTIKCL
jgi:Protein of unknown function (DUF2528)